MAIDGLLITLLWLWPCCNGAVFSAGIVSAHCRYGEIVVRSPLECAARGARSYAFSFEPLTGLCRICKGTQSNATFFPEGGTNYITGCGIPNVNLIAETGCYLIVNTEVPWDEAREDCSHSGGHLIAMETNDEIQMTVALAQTSGRMYWSGLNDIAIEGSFVWNSTGESETVTNWRNGDPNDEYPGQDCVLIRDTGLWDDVKCDSLRNYICEFHLAH